MPEPGVEWQGRMGATDSSPTMLKVLLCERHLQHYGLFKRAYQKAARNLGGDLVGTYPSEATFRRWLAGKIEGLPRAEHCAVLEAILPGWTAADLFSPYVAPDAVDGSTLLQELLRRRNIQDYQDFCRVYNITAALIDQSLVGTYPAEWVFYRWTSGDMVGLPYPDHCNVLEAMFPGYSARQLFGPRPAEGDDSHRSAALVSASTDLSNRPERASKYSPRGSDIKPRQGVVGAASAFTPQENLLRFGPRLNRRIGLGDVEAVREMASLFSRADQRRGGGYGRSAIAAYLRSDVMPQLNGVYVAEQTRREMLSAVGEIAYLVGWMAFDDADHSVARDYFNVALELATEANDPPLSGHVLRAMAHQALDLNLVNDAHDLATASVEGERYRGASPRERALLGVIHARSLVTRDEVGKVSSALLQAEEDLSNAGQGIPEPDRAFFFSEASLAHETGCALRDLGDLPGAEECFQRSIKLRDSSKFARTHAITLGYLGAVKARRGKVDEARAVWAKSLDSMQAVCSGRARQVVADMRATLLPLSKNDAAARDLDYRAVTYLADSLPS